MTSVTHCLKCVGTGCIFNFQTCRSSEKTADARMDCDFGKIQHVMHHQQHLEASKKGMEKKNGRHMAVT